MRVFIDTSAFLALEDRDDRHHDRAIGLLARMRDERPPLVTSNLILAETVSLVGRRIEPRRAVAFARRLHTSQVIRLVYLTQEVEAAALRTYEKFNDPRISFIDCTSFELMRLLKLDQAFAFDADFTRAGFTLYDFGT